MVRPTSCSRKPTMLSKECSRRTPPSPRSKTARVCFASPRKPTPAEPAAPKNPLEPGAVTERRVLYFDLLVGEGDLHDFGAIVDLELHAGDFGFGQLDRDLVLPAQCKVRNTPRRYRLLQQLDGRLVRSLAANDRGCRGSSRGLSRHLIAHAYAEFQSAAGNRAR